MCVCFVQYSLHYEARLCQFCKLFRTTCLTNKWDVYFCAIFLICYETSLSLSISLSVCVCVHVRVYMWYAKARGHECIRSKIHSTQNATIFVSDLLFLFSLPQSTKHQSMAYTWVTSMTAVINTLTHASHTCILPSSYTQLLSHG